MPNFSQLSATDLARRIREKRLGSAELLEYFEQRYSDLNPSINAIVVTDFDRARQRAKEADAALARGEIWGPLHGLPITLKDNIEVAGMPTSYGLPGFGDYMPPCNADVAQTLLNAGAIVFGKTNMPAMGADTQTFNDIYGQTNNPWNLERTPGGSSGGAAAAIAAGLTPLEIGNDIGGSIRFPAHFCGVYGHKPSYGIVSMHGPKPWEKRHASYPLDLDLLVNGPITRSAEDLMLAMDIIVGPPANQQKAVRISLPEPRAKSLRDFRVGVWLDEPGLPTEPCVLEVLQRLVDKLENSGVQIVEQRPDISLQRAYEMRNELEAATLSHTVPQDAYDWALQDAARRDANAGDRLAWSQTTTIRYRDWTSIHRERLQSRQQWQHYFEKVDLLLCPVARIAAHKHDHTILKDRLIDFNGESIAYWPVMGPWNSLSLVSHLPATVAPVGQTAESLPVGIQIIGPYLEDRTPIQFAHALEQEITGGIKQPPGFEL